MPLDLGVHSPSDKVEPAASVGTGSGAGLTEQAIGALGSVSAVRFDGERLAKTRHWDDVFIALYGKLNALHMQEMDKLPDDPYFGKYFMRLEPGKKTPKKYLKVKLGTNGDVRVKGLVNKIYLWRTDYYFRKLLAHLDVDASRIDVI